jgi:hypothetical protein
MADLTLITRAAQTLADDQDLRKQILSAGRASRRAVLRPAPKPTRIRRAGTAVREIGEVVTRAGAKAEAQRRAQRRTLVLRGAVVGTAGAVAAAVLTRRGSNPNGGPNV